MYCRVIGLCLLQNETCPLFLCRPIIKYILGREIRWHDLAFYDAAMFENLRGLLADTEVKDAGQILGALELTFTINDEVRTDLSTSLIDLSLLVSLACDV